MRAGHHFDVDDQGLSEAQIDAMIVALECEEKLAVTRVFLGGNALTRVPEAVRLFPNMVDLCIYRNEILELPNWLPAGLRQLWAYQNQLHTLPVCLTRMESLNDLDLSRNPRLPSDIGVRARSFDVRTILRRRFHACRDAVVALCGILRLRMHDPSSHNGKGNPQVVSILSKMVWDHRCSSVWG
jgi:Leucine-rich repeat (LRR) protein